MRVADEVQPEATAAMFDAEQTRPVPWWRRRMLGLDVETAPPEWSPDGPNVNVERVVSCAVALVGGGDTWSHSWLVNPGFAIPPESTAIHGIHNEDVADAPPIGEVLRDVWAVLEEAAEERMAFVVYNAPYDMTVLDRESRRLGVEPRVLQALRVVDPMLLDRMLDTFRKGSRKLADTTAIWNARAQRAAERAGREWRATDLLARARSGPHVAAADAIAGCRLGWLLAEIGAVYSYGRPVYEHDRPDRDLAARQAEWDATRTDLDRLHEWQRRWRYADQLRLREHWRAQGNPLWEGVQPEWPVYPEGVHVG